MKTRYVLTLTVEVREKVEAIAILAALQDQLIAIGSADEIGKDLGCEILDGNVSFKEVQEK